MRVTVDDGTRLEVREAGRGPAVLLVHGFGGAKEDFADHLETLGAHFRVVTFDHRGHGESDAPADPAAYSIDRLAADVVGVADALGIDRFRLLGHSMGGMVAQRVVRAHPQRVESLVLMDTAPGPVPGLDPDVVDLAAAICRDEGKAVLKPLLDDAATLETPSNVRLLRERPGYREFCDAKWEALSPVMWATLVVEIVHREDQLASLATVACPTLVIVGAEDRPFLDASRSMAATIPGAELVVVADAGHSPQFENAPAWFAAVDGFLRRVDTSTAKEAV
ncbi:MAG: alpha/beta fold hydrolase [Acidimicrobiia bacterium]